MPAGDAAALRCRSAPRFSWPCGSPPRPHLPPREHFGQHRRRPDDRFRARGPNCTRSRRELADPSDACSIRIARSPANADRHAVLSDCGTRIHSADGRRPATRVFAIPVGLGDLAVGLTAFAAASAARNGQLSRAIWWNVLGLGDLALALTLGNRTESIRIYLNGAAQHAVFPRAIRRGAELHGAAGRHAARALT